MYRFEKSGESENGSVSPAPCSLSAPGVLVCKRRNHRGLAGFDESQGHTEVDSSYHCTAGN